MTSNLFKDLSEVQEEQTWPVATQGNTRRREEDELWVEGETVPYRRRFEGDIIRLSLIHI